MVDDQVAKHNAKVLACAQALGGANPAIVVSLGGIVGQALAEDKGLATLPVSLMQLGLALGTLPAAAVMRRLGRRTGYVVGALIGVSAGLVAAFGIARASFALFCLGRSLQMLGRHAEARKPLALAACLQPGRRDYRIYRDRARARAAASSSSN